MVKLNHFRWIVEVPIFETLRNCCSYFSLTNQERGNVSSRTNLTQECRFPPFMFGGSIGRKGSLTHSILEGIGSPVLWPPWFHYRVKRCHWQLGMMDSVSCIPFFVGFHKMFIWFHLAISCILRWCRIWAINSSFKYWKCLLQLLITTMNGKK